MELPCSAPVIDDAPRRVQMLISPLLPLPRAGPPLSPEDTRFKVRGAEYDWIESTWTLQYIIRDGIFLARLVGRRFTTISDTHEILVTYFLFIEIFFLHFSSPNRHTLLPPATGYPCQGGKGGVGNGSTGNGLLLVLLLLFLVTEGYIPLIAHQAACISRLEGMRDVYFLFIYDGMMYIGFAKPGHHSARHRHPSIYLSIYLSTYIVISYTLC